MMGIGDFIIDDILPTINILIAVDAVRRNVLDMRHIKDSRFKIIVMLTTVGAAALALLYLLILLGADHIINPSPEAFGALYIRPLLTYIIVLMDITARNRHYDRESGEPKHDITTRSG